MSDIKMPEPVAEVMTGYVLYWTGNGFIKPLIDRNSVVVGSKLITTEQAEAYANARVLEALEMYEKSLRNGLLSLLEFNRESVDLAITDEGLGARMKINKEPE